jgi:YjbE family integral membrane protein
MGAGEGAVVIVQLILAGGGIALLDMVLSGDNALVIAAAASRLGRAQRLLAIIWGGIGAFVFRIALAFAATEVLRVPLLQALGGLTLLVIAARVLPDEDGEGPRVRQSSSGFFAAVATILVADATMSLDNILAVAALAHGNLVLLAGGLAFSMLILFVASALISRLMEAAPWLLDLAAVVIALTAGSLITGDPFLRQHVVLSPPVVLAVQIGCVDGILLYDVVRRIAWRQRTARRREHSSR